MHCKNLSWCSEPRSFGLCKQKSSGIPEYGENVLGLLTIRATNNIYKGTGCLMYALMCRKSACKLLLKKPGL